MSNMKTNEEIIAALKELFERVFEGDLEIDDLKEETHLQEDLGMNSIALLYMAMAAEEEFGIKFENEDFEQMQTVGDVVARIQKG